MNAQGPMMRRGNLSPSDGRVKFDRSDAGRNLPAKPEAPSPATLQYPPAMTTMR